MEATLNLDVMNIKDAYFNSVIVEGQEYKIEEKMEIKIKFNEIESEIGAKCVTLKIKDKTSKRSDKDHYFEVMEGINTGILFTSRGKTRDLIFRDDEKIKVRIGEDNKIERNLISQNGIKRLLLINLSMNDSDSVYINDQNLTDEIFLIDNELSIQVSVVNLEERVFPFKTIASKSFQSFFTFFKNYDKKLKDFHEVFKEYMKSNCTDSEIKNKLGNLGEVEKIFFTKLNLPKKILENNYNEKQYFDFLSLCSLFHVLNGLFTYNKDKKEIRSFYELFCETQSKIEKDNDLNYYQKSVVIIDYGLHLKEAKELEKFKKINFSYHLTKNFELNSVGLSVMDFLKAFIEELNENNPFYFPLILIDSGIFTYKGDCIYGFGLINKKMLISHLKDILPDVICTYYVPDLDYDYEEVLPNKTTGCVTINLATIFNSLEEANICKEIKDQKVRSYALKMVIILFQEIFGHKITCYNSDTKSPNRFFDKEGKNLMVLRHRSSFEKGKNVIMIPGIF